MNQLKDQIESLEPHLKSCFGMAKRALLKLKDGAEGRKEANYIVGNCVIFIGQNDLIEKTNLLPLLSDMIKEELNG